LWEVVEPGELILCPCHFSPSTGHRGRRAERSFSPCNNFRGSKRSKCTENCINYPIVTGMMAAKNKPPDPWSGLEAAGLSLSISHWETPPQASTVSGHSWPDCPQRALKWLAALQAGVVVCIQDCSNFLSCRLCTMVDRPPCRRWLKACTKEETRDSRFNLILQQPHDSYRQRKTLLPPTSLLPSQGSFTSCTPRVVAACRQL